MTNRLGPAPKATSPAVTRSMKGNRGRDTKPELLLRALLRDAGYPGYRLHWKKAPGRPDISYPGRRVAIFVNGCFWHRCPRCQPSLPKSHPEFWSKKFELTRERDARKQNELEALGWTVITLWECELLKDPRTAVAAVSAVLDQRKSS